MISQSEKNTIKSMYGLKTYKKDFIFELCTTVDGRYFILHDEVFDIKEQKLIGNLWSSIDVFKTIFSNVKVTDKTGQYNQIKESILSIPILENKKNLYGLRDILLEWSFTENTWLGRTLSSSGKSVSDSISSGIEGLKEFGVVISRGEWSEILTLMSKGVKWVLRKLKDSMFSNLGMIVDSILIATGVGKSVQWIPWALITSLDVYQLSTNDWPQEEMNDPIWMKYLTLGFDVLGLVTTGVAAKSAKVSFSPLKTMNLPQATTWIQKNPKIKKTIELMLSGINKVPSLLSKAQTTIAKTFPTGSKFISSSIGMLKSIMGKFTQILQSLIGVRATSGVKAGVTTGTIVYGIDNQSGGSSNTSTPIIPREVTPDYGGI